MASLSISRAWEGTKAALSRDHRLYSAVALALLVLPGVVNDLMTPAAPPGELPPAGPWMIVAILTLVAAVVGQLAVMRLTLGSRVSVGEAIRHAASRTPAYLGATLLWLFPVGIVAGLLMSQLTEEPAARNAVIGFAMLVFAVVILWVAVRFILSGPVATSEGHGPLTILQRSWHLSKGHSWRLLAFLLLLILAAIILIIVANVIGGTLAHLLFGSTDRMTVGALLVAIVSQIVSAAMTVVLAVMLAELYSQLSGPDHASVSVPSSGD